MSAPLKIEMFGTMRTWVEGEPLPRMRSRKARWLLALLALRNGGPVGRGWMAGTLWPDAEATVALTNLRSVVSDLRRALGSQGERLKTPDRKTLALDLDRAEVDVLTFDLALRAGNPERAVALYTGPLLEDCDEEWASQDRKTRERACLGALREMAEADPERAVEFYERAVKIAPWQDGPRRDFMTALAKSGDLNAALATYRDFAQALRGETGASPDLQTTDLYVRLRSGESAAGTPEPVATPPSALPHAITSFVGREDELLDIGRQLHPHRLVTLVGMGGLGKTRLAREAAQSVKGDYADGAWLVPLEAVSDEGGLLRQAATVLGIKETPGRTLLESILASLRPKRLLLLLDNCEHLIAACSRLAERLLGDCPGIRILATSREPLGLVGEKVWPVPGLTVPDPAHLPEHPATRRRVLMGYESVQLFVERAKEASAGFELTGDNAESVARLCVLLEGSPLALELAACRTRTMGVQEIANRLSEHRLDLLTAGRHGGIARHHTLRAALDWSYSLLLPEERTLLARLSVFSGGWTLSAAEAVSGASADVLESLVDKSFVVFSPNGRYRMLDTVRQYAKEKLAASGEEAEVEIHHARWFTGLAERWEAEEASLEAFEAEMGNFHAAMNRCDADPETGLRLAGALGDYWSNLRAYEEGRRYLGAALARPGAEAPTFWRAKACRAIGSSLFHADPDGAMARFHEALSIQEELGDRAGASRSLRGMGLTAYFGGDFESAETWWERSLTAARESGDRRRIAIALSSLAMACPLRGDYRRARALSEESLTLNRELGEDFHTAWTLRSIGSLAFDFGDFETVRKTNEEALGIFRELNLGDPVAWCLDDLGKVATELRQLALGYNLLEQSLQIHQNLENPLGIASTLNSLGGNALAQGDLYSALAYQSESLTTFQSQDHRLGIARATDSLGDVLARQGKRDEARSRHREALAIWREVGDRKHVRDSLVRLGNDADEALKAVPLWACSSRLGEEMGVPLPSVLQEPYERGLEAARSQVGFEEAWGTGQRLELEAAIELALRS